MQNADPKPLIRFLALLAVVIGAASAAIQILLWARDAVKTKDYFLGGGVVTSMLLVAGSTTLFFLRDPPNASRLARLILEDCRKIMPDDTANALTSYIEIFLKSVLSRRQKASSFSDIIVSRLNRIFTVIDADVVTEERYEWQTTRKQGRRTFPISQSGGNISSLKSISAFGAEVESNSMFPRELTVEENTDRFIQIDLHLAKVAKPGEDKIVFYRDVWRNAMLPEWDAVFLPHPTYFSKPISQIVFTLRCDRPIIYSYAYSVDLNKCSKSELDVVRNRDARFIDIAIDNPRPDTFYVLLFRRADK